MTDPRIGAALPSVIAQLPDGTGVIVRHDEAPRTERAAIAELCRVRGIVFGVAGDVALARDCGASLVHRPHSDSGGLPLSLPVHDEREAGDAARRGAALAFVSPIFATRSHEGVAGIGLERAVKLAKRSATLAIALGGMDRDRFAELDGDVFYGWAGIDAWLRT
ncbi:thiamine phosphate synthase [Sphingomonas sp. LY29]|uniref:thiamine phosphate synthase n=1 Tax=Sphingomonas sp. LY29 TaxID=3095341 RepID=UPI002D79AE9F|nr:thiamine phosphate synthase [Sphingomonas sp. LY29]WRP24913.1 thiamine phosphate synthase [Sphingomonas sp. LY29]